MNERIWIKCIRCFGEKWVSPTFGGPKTDICPSCKGRGGKWGPR